MKHQIACHGCDLLLSLPSVQSTDKKWVCPRCRHKISSGHHNPLDYALALSLCSFVLLLLVNYFPFLSFEAKGQFREISFFQASTVLYEQGFILLSLLVVTFTLILPTLYLIMLLLLLLPIKLKVSPVNPIFCGKLLVSLTPWVMVDVFLMGILVALIKMASLADLYFGVAFWSYLSFTAVFTYILSLVDPHKLWLWVEVSLNLRNIK